MLAPLSWLKEYVNITLSPKELGERLTEIGLGTQSIKKPDGDVIFEFEVTPNRPDLLSILGIAREIAAIANTKVKVKNYFLETPTKTTLPMKLNIDYNLFHRWTAVAIENVKVKPSPQWMQERLKKVGLRPINNIVDVTNYVMFELGIPLHAFDYNQIRGQEMTVAQAAGGERFSTVDEKTYSLPKSAIIIKDKERIIDLAGIKGGLNSGISNKTTNLFLQTTADNQILIRRASYALGVRSDASAIYERGVDKGGTVETLKRAAKLILETAQGKVASEIIDRKIEAFEPWKTKLTHAKLVNSLGIDIDPKQVKSLLERLNLITKIENQKRPFYTVTIPTYRNDLKIEEDVIEEVARLYGYNNFPKTIPTGQIPTKQIPYSKDYSVEEKVKNILKASGFSEIYTYSLISEKDLVEIGLKPENVLRVDNPVSREFEYLRPTLKINLLKALKQNKPNFEQINLFELGKVYLGKNLDTATEEYFLSGIANKKNFFEIKGILEVLFEELGDPTKYIEILNEGIFFELSYSKSLKKARMQKKFTPLPKYPPIIEDLAIAAHEKVKTKELTEEIKKQSHLIASVSLLDQFETTRTFHIVYQHKERNLTTEEVGKIREKILKALKQKFNARPKE